MARTVGSGDTSSLYARHREFTTMPHIVIAALAVLLFAVVPAQAQRIEVKPETVLAGEPVRIVLKGFERNAEITLVAERPVRGFMPGQPVTLYRSSAVFRSTHVGTLDLATARPLSGDYREPDVRGLFWSMQASDEEAQADWPLDEVRLRAEHDGEVLAQARLLLKESRADLRTIPVSADAGLPGAILVRADDEIRRPAIIVLGGSEGGDWFARSMSPRLASYGYAVLGLPYYAPPQMQRPELAGLPADFVEIPVERLEQARAWLLSRDDVSAERVGLYGVSKGAEFVLIAASRYDWIAAVAAIVPSDVVWEGFGFGYAEQGTRPSFSWQGEPLPFVPYDNLAGEFQRGDGPAILRRAHDHGRTLHAQRVEGARIPIENYRGALLVAGGMLDAVWGSGPMAQNIVERRTAAGLTTNAVIRYGAGHMLTGHGWSPTTQSVTGTMAMGGEARASAQAQAETWAATLNLFEQALLPPAMP